MTVGSESHSTRRYELGMPLFAGLDLGALVASQLRLQRGEPEGLGDLARTLAGMGDTRSIRRLAALWTATEEELKKAEMDAPFRESLEDAAALRPFGESVKAAFDFFGGLMALLGASLVSSDPAKTTEETPASPVSPEGSLSGDS